jgi:outer membrane protein W
VCQSVYEDALKRSKNVSKTKTLMAITLVAVAAPGSTSAQSLAKRHQIELRMGGWSQVTDTRTAVGIGGVTTTVASNGFIGGVAYGHWLQEELAFRISAGLMAASIDVQTSVSGVATDFAAVVPVLFGMRYYFPRSTYGEQFRPFAGAGVGTLIGSHEIVQTGMTVVAETRTEAALGGEVEAGVSIVLGKYVLATIAGAYSLMTDFDRPIGGSRNYSGPQMTLGISLLLGGGSGGN